ncbi:hypothetical protein [Streptomyces sviceus]
MFMTNTVAAGAGDGRHADIDHGGDPGPDRGGRGAGSLKEGSR